MLVNLIAPQGSSASSSTVQSSPGGAAQAAAASTSALAAKPKEVDAASDEEESDDDEDDDDASAKKAPVVTEAYMHNLEDALLNAIRVRNAVLRENENLRESLRRRHIDADVAETTLSVHLARARDEAAQAAEAHAQARATLLAASGSDPELREQFIALRAEKEAFDATLNEVKADRDTAREQVKKLEEEVSGLECCLSEEEDARNETEEQNEELEEQQERLQERIEELQADAELAGEELQEAHELRRSWRAKCRQRDALLGIYGIPIPRDPVEAAPANDEDGNASQQQQSSSNSLKRKEAQLDEGFEIRLSNGLAITVKRDSVKGAAQASPPKKAKLSPKQEPKEPSDKNEASSSNKAAVNGQASTSSATTVRNSESSKAAAANQAACAEKQPVDKTTRAEHIDALCAAGLCLHE